MSWPSNTDREDKACRRSAAIGECPPAEVLQAVDAAAAALAELAAGGVELRVVVGREPRRAWIEVNGPAGPAGELAASRALDLLACGAVCELLAEGGASV